MTTQLEHTQSPAESVHAEEVLAMLGRQLGESATVGAVFGNPIVAGERTVVPVARLSATARGKGAGFRTEPLAVVEITPRRVRIQPIVDVNRLIGRVFTSVFGFVIAALVIRVFFETRILAAAPRRRLSLAGVPPFAARLRARLAA